MALFHLVTEDDWQRAQTGAAYAPPSLATEGFVHCTGSIDATLSVADAYFRHATQPVLVLRVDASQLSVPVRFEEPSGPPRAHHVHRRVFPHVYGPIPHAALTVLGRLRRENEGFAWPSEQP